MTKLPRPSAPRRLAASFRPATGLLAGDLPRSDKTMRLGGRDPRFNTFAAALPLFHGDSGRRWKPTDLDGLCQPVQRASPARGDRVNGGVLGGCVRPPLCLDSADSLGRRNDRAVDGIEGEGWKVDVPRA